MYRRWRAVRGGAGGGGGGRWGAALLLAVVAGLVLRLETAERRDTATFPRLGRASLAHLLADFTAHPHGAGGAGAWRLDDERGNYTWWTYRVSFVCGDRCAGTATIAATDHRVERRVTLCTTLALIPWFTYCDELEVDSTVSAMAADTGSVVSERAVARCGAARVLAGWCGSMLDGHRAAHRAALLARVQSADSRTIRNIY